MRRLTLCLVAVAWGMTAAQTQAGTLSVQYRFELIQGGGYTWHDLVYDAPAGERNDFHVDETSDATEAVVHEAKAPVLVASGNELNLTRPGGSSPQWGCKKLRPSVALCAVLPAAPTTCDLISCNDESAQPPWFGRFTVNLGDQDDRLSAADGTPQIIDCGSGTDAVTADATDTIGADCEHVTIQAVPTY
jgi:hypothetical protein